MWGLAFAAIVAVLSSCLDAYASSDVSGPPADGSLQTSLVKLGLVWRSIVDIATAVPELPFAIVATVRALDDSKAGQGLVSLASTVTGAFLVALVSVRILRALFVGLRADLVGSDDRRPGPVRAAGVIGLDLVDRIVVAVVAGIGASVFPISYDVMSQFGQAILFAGAIWWTIMLLVEVLLRPKTPRLRLVSIDDRSAKFAWRLAGAVTAAMLAVNKLLPLLIGSGLPVPHAQAIALAVGTAVVVCINLSLRSVGVDGLLALRTARFALAAFWLAMTIGVLRVDLSIVDSFVVSFLVIAVAFATDRVIGLDGGAEANGRLRRVVRRCFRVAAAAVILALLLETWLVGQFEILSTAQWRDAIQSSFTSIAALFAGYIAWEAMRHWIDRRISGSAPVIGPGGDGGEIATASRFTTLLPLFRTFGAIAIFILTMLVALSEWGVNIVPLLAGASIFGLAISFGSQALVRDIVSGIFFIADDAFRVGEYVDTGKLKGTVEAITVRSVKLRHQNGQIHTIPFGQLQYVTNFSRDWSTIKFNLRLARDSDIEKVRKTIKRIGAEMQEDDELGPEMIEPLKLQGVADIVDNALVVRLKFTARPIKPSWVQREALKRIHSRFRDVGIEFASNSVTVQTAGPNIGGAAAATSMQVPAKE